MKRGAFLFAVLAIIGLMLMARPGSARMSALTETQMSEISGQGGIRIQGDTLGLDVALDTLYYGDDDGVGGNSAGGYLSLCGVSLKGSLYWADPIAIDIVTENRGPGNTEVTGVSLTLTDMTVTIDSFQIDAIRVGPQPGTGKSFGSIGIKNMTCTISGNVKIFAH
jgi:hypothetical protein